MFTAIHQTLRRATLACAWTALALVTGCGGGSGDSGATRGKDGNSALAPSSSLAQICTLAGEQKFIRSYLDEVYLWYRDVPNISAASYTTLSSYFYALLVTKPDTNNLPTDQFSFVVDAADADAFSTGVNVGYGVQWKDDAQGRRRVALISANSPAADAGMARGGILEEIIERTPASWYPNEAGAFARFSYRDTPDSAPREIRLNARTVTENPVPLVSTVTTPSGKRAGYLLFNDHSEGAQDKLIEAVRNVQNQGLQELVMDMRYNGGGYLYIAQTLASMVSGPSANGKVFEALRYNDKRTADSRNSTYGFTSTVLYSENSFATGYALPRLNLRRVYILTSDNTCSASESVINSLRGVDVEVVLIGTGTCGKPYGFTRKDNCNRSFYPIEFQGTNNKGFGDYSAGFAPTCTAADDLDHPLGAVAEGQLAGALQHIDTGQCAATQTAGVLNPARKALLRLWASSSADALDAARPPHGRLLLPVQTPAGH